MNSIYQDYIINRLRTLRQERKISQYKVSQILGISPGQVGSIESNKFAAKYTLEQIYILCKEMKVSIDQIFLTDEDFTNGKDIINNLIKNIIKYETGR